MAARKKRKSAIDALCGEVLASVKAEIDRRVFDATSDKQTISDLRKELRQVRVELEEFKRTLTPQQRAAGAMGLLRSEMGSR